MLASVIKDLEYLGSYICFTEKGIDVRKVFAWRTLNSLKKKGLDVTHEFRAQEESIPHNCGGYTPV